MSLYNSINHHHNIYIMWCATRSESGTKEREKFCNHHDLIPYSWGLLAGFWHCVRLVKSQFDFVKRDWSIWMRDEIEFATEHSQKKNSKALWLNEAPQDVLCSMEFNIWLISMARYRNKLICLHLIKTTNRGKSWNLGAPYTFYNAKTKIQWAWFKLFLQYFSIFRLK